MLSSTYCDWDSKVPLVNQYNSKLVCDHIKRLLFIVIID
jgi:hypothetical protein